MTTKQDFQLTRQQHFWIASAIVCSSLVIWSQLPVWVPIICLSAVVWRTQRYFGGYAAPSRWVMLSTALSCVCVVLFFYRPPVGLEPMSIILITALSLKFLEVRRRSDTLITLYLCHFVAATGLLFVQGVGAFLWSLMAILVTLGAQVQMERSSIKGFSINRQALGSLKPVFYLTLLALPVALVLFMAIPRMPSFWAIPLAQSGKTGFSDRLSLGDVGTLARSDELAFRAAFEGPLLPQPFLYWRGLVLHDFDGQEWSNDGTTFFGMSRQNSTWTIAREPGWVEQLSQSDRPTDYDIFLEPHGEQWLFALDYPHPVQTGTSVTQDMLLRSRDPIGQRTRYAARSFLGSRFQAQRLSVMESRVYTQLPNGFNPRAVQLAEEWGQQGFSARELVRNIADRFRSSFVYTLSPPAYGENAIDQFLFDQQRGFCEHYASAAAFLLRASGVPARIVLGYQGGEVSPNGDYLVVRQLDAHAWVEYWEEGLGWSRFDPTAAVAPERIESGIDQIAELEELPLTESAFSLLNYKNTAFFNWIRWRMDEINYLWARWILSYGEEHQRSIWIWINSLKSTLTSLLSVFGAIVALLVSGYFLRHSLRSRHRDKNEILNGELLGFRRRLEDWGVEVAVSDSPIKMVDLALQRCDSSQSDTLKTLRTQLLQTLYKESGSRRDLVRALKNFRFIGKPIPLSEQETGRN